jgi:dephospho-CoA kinase
MLVIGITGGIGSGKGLATEFFQSRGAAVIDADEVARDLTGPDSPVLAEIAREFGRDVVGDDGRLDRGKLAQRVFGDAGAVARLNAVTHPPIAREVRRRIELLAGEGKAEVACVVAPLLLEAGLEEAVHHVLVMVAEEKERVRRVVERDGLSEEEARERIEVQMSPEEQCGRADWVVDTTCGRETARRQLEGIWVELKR